ncbi:MAG: hypothetical protein ACE1Y4_03410, partial [Lysobacterales bacterium]
DGDGAAGEQRRRLHIAAALEQAGVRGAVVRQIQNIPGLTAEDVRTVSKRLMSEPDIRNHAGVLIRRLKDGRFGDVA